MQGELTLRLSSLWMYIAYTSSLLELTKRGRNFFYAPLLMIWQKGGKKFGDLCMHVYACLLLFAFTIDIRAIGIRACLFHFLVICMFIFSFDIRVFIFVVYKKGKKYLVLFDLFMHIYVVHSLHIFIIYCYAWVKGELLWSLTLIHTYITPWVLSSSKRGRLLAQRPFTLVLMMINSCSYSLLIILWYLVLDIWSRY